MNFILYLSVSNGYLNDDELSQILSTSRINNQKAGITGVLLYSSGQFIQLLEGEKKQVEETFERIKRDRRHLDVTVLSQGKLRERCFPKWFMGYKAIKSDSYSTLNDFLEHAKTFDERDCELPLKLLKSFVRKNRLNTD